MSVLRTTKLEGLERAQLGKEGGWRGTEEKGEGGTEYETVRPEKGLKLGRLDIGRDRVVRVRSPIMPFADLFRTLWCGRMDRELTGKECVWMVETTTDEDGRDRLLPP